MPSGRVASRKGLLSRGWASAHPLPSSGATPGGQGEAVRAERSEPRSGVGPARPPAALAPRPDPDRRPLGRIAGSVNEVLHPRRLCGATPTPLV